MSIASVMTRTIHWPKPEVETANSKARPIAIELQTENGFSIVRRCDIDQRCSAYGTEHGFVVRDPHGSELDIIVDFSAKAIDEAVRCARGHLTRESTFWLTAAERHLSDYLGENEDYPPNGRITIDRLTPNDIDLAQRWVIESDGLSKHHRGSDVPSYEEIR